MKRTKCGNKKGFTIIETSLVLAIAGLILVMAFIALPALQRQQRDTKRKDDAMHFMQALKNYQSNNRGKLPDLGTLNNTSLLYSSGNFEEDAWIGNIEDIARTPWGGFYIDYLGEDFVTPDGGKYSFQVTNCRDEGGSGVCADGSNGYGKPSLRTKFNNRTVELFMYTPATCENGKPVPSNNKRNVAMVVMLESGGDYCVNN